MMTALGGAEAGSAPYDCIGAAGFDPDNEAEDGIGPDAAATLDWSSLSNGPGI